MHLSSPGAYGAAAPWRETARHRPSCHSEVLHPKQLDDSPETSVAGETLRRGQCAPHVKRRNNVCIDKKHAKSRDQSRPQAMAASMSSVVGVNPPRSLTGLGAFSGWVLLAAILLRMNSALASFSFSCSWDGANFQLTHQIIWQIESRFHAARFPESCFSVKAGH